MTMHRPCSSIVCVLILLLASGCSTSQPVQYFTLSPMGLEGGMAVTTGVPPLRVAMVSVPDYLDRHHLVTRTSPSTVTVAEFAYWAGSLDDEVTRVLAANLAARLGADKVTGPETVRPPGSSVIETTIVRFEPWRDGHVELVARWTIRDKAGAVLASTNDTCYRVNSAGTAPAAAVAAMSGASSELCRDIAAAYMAAAGDKAR
jgi:hypothetical protein